MQSRNTKNVDVLIVGAGPAGLVAATWMARCGVKTLIVDKRTAETPNGQADGVQARTLEILDSFGLADAVWNESYHMGENPGPDGLIRRSSRMANTIPGLSRFRQGTILSQHRLEEILLESLSKYPHVEVQRRVIPDDLAYSSSKAESDTSHPIIVSLRRAANEKPTENSRYKLPLHFERCPFTNPNDSKNVHPRRYGEPSSSSPSTNGHDVVQNSGLEQKRLGCVSPNGYENDSASKSSDSSDEYVQAVNAQYMIGCDGAHSWTRSRLGIEMLGEQTDFVWGVIDIIPITDFPDIRSRCAIHSANSGSIMLIPRQGRLIRIYCQLTEVSRDQAGRFDRSGITEKTIFRTAQRIMKPYTLDYTYCENWTVYQIGQRVGERFNIDNRIFLAGDAVHTHSPKAGQGMNVSIQDTYNLGWKLALVLKGFADRSLLSTYEQERRAVALELIAFDQHFSKLFSSRPAKDAADNAGMSMDVFKEAFVKQKMFSSGFAVDYGPNILVAKEGGEIAPSKHYLASRILLGKSFPNAQVVNQSDARPWEFARWLKADGRFRIILFAGNVSDQRQMQRVHGFCSELTREGSWLQRTVHRGWRVRSYVELLTIHSACREAVELAEFPELLHPFHETYGWDYEKIFVDGKSYYEPHGEAYQKLGVDKQRGCVVVTRPDQHVGWIGELEDTSALGEYFEGFLATYPPAK